MPRLNPENIRSALRGAFFDAAERSRKTGVPMLYRDSDGNVVDRIPPSPTRVSYTKSTQSESSIVREDPPEEES